MIPRPNDAVPVPTDGLLDQERSDSAGLDLEARFARLEDVDDPERGRSLLWRQTVVGTSLASDWKLPDGAPSGVHCVITHDADPLRVRDVAGLGRVRVNGVHVRVATLYDGDVLEIGDHRFRVTTNLPGQETRYPFVGRFRVRGVLGSGGMAWLFSAEDTATGERMAVKLLPSQHSDRMRLQFRIEARAVGRLDHPNVVHQLWHIDEADAHAIVFEFVRGLNLAEYVAQRGPVPWPLACSFTAQAARGLQHAHDRGVVHRDVKPANLQIQGDGSTKLLDFGLALVKDDPDQPRLVELLPRRPMGTPDYIAPEQIRSSHTVDGLADVYALGGTLYFALTGEVPFPIEPPRRKLRAHRRRLPRTIRKAAPDVPRELEVIVWRMMAKEPSERFGSAAEVAEALLPLARQQPIRFDARAVESTRASVARRKARRLEGLRPPSEVIPTNLAEMLEQVLAKGGHD